MPRDVSELSFVLPARNEALGLASVLPSLRALYPGAEILVVDDGSADATREVCETHGARVVAHAYGRGNGAAVKSGARAAAGRWLVLMDADGQHRPEDVERLLERLGEGFDMVVGAREPDSQAGAVRRLGNAFYNRLASWMVGHRIADLTSGFRVVDAALFREFLHLLPNGFSYPTTVTMAFFRAGYAVGYEPVRARARSGTSHLSVLRDGLRFLLIIFRIATLFSPLRLFFPASVAFFCTGLGYYLYTYATAGRFTNMSALLFVTSVVVFLIGLVSEQITMLLYQGEGHRRR